MRQLNFNSLVIERMINHKVLRRKSEDKHSEVQPSDKVLVPGPEMAEKILERLQESLGRGGKGFELKIDPAAVQDEESFFSLCFGIEDQQREGFIDRTTRIAERLAFAQTRTNIPPSYLLFIEARDEDYDDKPVYIVIKAEPHEAFRQTADEIELVGNLILSPNQDLYKAALLYPDEVGKNGEPFPNGTYTAVVFDEQFNKLSGLTSYFYEDFLGFTQHENAPIQSKLFFEKTKKFIELHAPAEQRQQLLEALKNMFTVDQEQVIHPVNFATRFLDPGDNQALYIRQVANELPSAIAKDRTLVNNSFKQSSINFKGNIKVSGKADLFSQNVRVLESPGQLADLASMDGYTVVLIKGRPFDLS